MMCLLFFIMVCKWNLFALVSVSDSTNQFFEKDYALPMQVQDSVTRKIIEHHFSAFKENDLENILSDYSDESIIFTPDTVYRGLKQIESLFYKPFAPSQRVKQQSLLINLLQMETWGM